MSYHDYSATGISDGLLGNIDLSTLYPGAIGATGPASVINTGSWFNSATASISIDPIIYDDCSYNVKITREGINLPEGSDLTVGNVSLREFMDSVSERLAMLRPNPQLEAEWEELRALGEQYRQLEAELKEKAQAWNILKKE